MRALCPILISLHYLAIIKAIADILLSIIYQAVYIRQHICVISHIVPPEYNIL